MSFLRPHQFDALKRMHNGCILNGGVGTGKSRTSLAYYTIRMGGVVDDYYIPKKAGPPKDLYIITTARKRDTKEWDEECNTARKVFGTIKRNFRPKVVIDSWNNIKKYSNVYGAFFIFDEDRVTGSGVWVKTFLKLAKKNEWIILSATPGDVWMDYCPVFVANGFFKNKSDFIDQHVIYKRFSKFPQIDKYIGTKYLDRLRDSILISMEFERSTIPHHINVVCDYDKVKYKEMWKTRWNPFKDEPFETVNELCYASRKISNSDPSRGRELRSIVKKHKKVIVFYNFDYELEIIKNYKYGDGFVVKEWNGHVHDPLPDGDKWVYAVQYAAGNEGWNCITTDTLVFFSQSYSYKVTVQAAGRIDRMNTPYTNLYYYHFLSSSPIDLAIRKALSDKKEFNERAYVEGRK